MGGYKIEVSVKIIDENGDIIRDYLELLRSGGKILSIKTLESADNIVKTMAKDVRKMCLVSQ